MLQIPKHISLNNRKSYADLTDMYLPNTFYEPTVSSEKQHEIISQLDGSVNQDRFYFSVDIKNNCITNCNGISRWLGYNNANFLSKDYLEIIHPNHTTIQTYYAASLFELLIEGALTLQLLQPTWATCIALKHQNGKYLYCKRECSPFQISIDNRMTEYISRITIIKEFANEDYSLRIYNDAGQLNEVEEKLQNNVKKKFEENAGFSVQELRILKRYAYVANASSETIAHSFKIEKSTVETHNKRILKKVENEFGQSFDNAKKAAEYFRRVQLL